MAVIPKQTTTLDLIDTIQLPKKEDTGIVLKLLCEIIEEKANEKPRGYLGMSSIGDPCSRKLWYEFHFATDKNEFPERTKRIFDTGHIAEAFVIKDLEKIGCEVTNAQAECVGVSGHFKGHIDGEVVGVIEAPKTVHLLEIKTHNDKSFKDVAKKGVKASKPVHYAQVVIYMKKRKLTRALYMAYNKNTSEYYPERIYADNDHARGLEEKATYIISSEEPPPKEFSRTWFACKWCDHFSICHDNTPAANNCRTCVNVDICDDGVWKCAKHKRNLSIEEQKKGCGDYQIGWGL